MYKKPENQKQPQVQYTSPTIANHIKEPAPPLSSTAVLNYGLCVHDWYLMPEAYSAPLIVEAIERFGVGRGDTILDPFSGTGTTVVTAVLNGVNGIGLEVNPFLCFASRVKLDWSVNLSEFRVTLTHLLDEAKILLKSLSKEPGLFSPAMSADVVEKSNTILSEVDEPDMPRLHKWMTQVVVQKVLILRNLIETLVPKHIRPYFLLALAAILRPASNMKLTPHAFGSNKRKEDAPVYDLFEQKMSKIYTDLKHIQSSNNQIGKGQIFHCDARGANNLCNNMPLVSLAITSPPYLNNLDYTMQTRMELFFLKFVNSMVELRSLRKTMVTCDAKAMYKDVKDSDEVKDIQSIQKIAARLKEVHRGKNWGWDYPFMTTQYFGGMFKVLKAIKPILKRRARFVLVVGESAHSGVKVPVPDLLAELGEKAGYKAEAINVLRSRRSSSHNFELCESEVILQKK